jgi:hypothetical protein
MTTLAGAAVVGCAVIDFTAAPATAILGVGAQGSGSCKSGLFIGGFGSCGPGDVPKSGDCAKAAAEKLTVANARTKADFITPTFLSKNNGKDGRVFPCGMLI